MQASGYSSNTHHESGSFERDVDQRQQLKALRRTCMNLLARREHSAVEMRQKIQQKLPELVYLLPEVIAQLQIDRLQSDERFAKAYIRMRIMKEYGPQRIALELKEKGVSQPLINELLDNGRVNWLDLLEALIVRKYPQLHMANNTEKLKIMGFLSRKGYAEEAIREFVRFDI